MLFGWLLIKFVSEKLVSTFSFSVRFAIYLLVTFAKFPSENPRENTEKFRGKKSRSLVTLFSTCAFHFILT